ncbi:hypothetical protein BJ944DRAFT_243699 [Cunninghamella echinulata]|nr:hypothetical protein BJ944DRAFT_243699 [Cunninghamella echinulata]
MAFRFNWPEFDIDFYNEAKSQLEAALNKGNKPKNIVDYITVKELNMGTQAPELEILEIGELTTDKFRGIFKLTYAGDAYIVLQTKVQANPMHAKHSSLPRHARPNILAADQPLVVPMLLRISDLKLRGIVVLVVSKTKGITLVFKNDPLENILISSTFDSVTSVRNFLQREIEKQLRNLFQEDLPVMIHNLSLRHIQSEQEKAKKQQQEEKLKAQQLRKLERRKKNRSSTITTTTTNNHDGITSPPLSVFSDPGLRQHMGLASFYRQQQLLSSSVASQSRSGSTVMPNSSISVAAANNHHHHSQHYDSASMPDLSHKLSQQQQSPQPITPSVHLSDLSFPFIEDPSSFLDSARFATLYRPGSGMYNSFSDLYNATEQPTAASIKSIHHSGNSGNATSDYFSQQQQQSPTNLSTLELLYHQQLASSVPPSHPDAVSIIPKTIPDIYSDDDAYYYDEDEEDDNVFYDDEGQRRPQPVSSPSTSSAIATSSSVYDMYIDDVDAPWYVTEGLGMPNTEEEDDTLQPLILPSDQSIVLDPFENAGAAKLAQLSKNHHTISPFTYTIDHVTYRSLPHTVKPSIRPKQKKIPKRRIIRLNLSSSTPTSN